MVLWLGVWAGVVVAEALLYALGPKLFRSFAWMRYVCVGIVWGALIGADIGMMLVDWRCWIFVILFSPYRLINLARLAKFRLQADRLRAVSLRAHGWLMAVVVMTGLFFVSQRLRRIDVVDAGWGLSCIAIALSGFLLQGGNSLRWDTQALTTLLVMVWGSRLAWHVARRIARTRHEDARYVALRRKWKGNLALQTYLRIYLLQSFLALVVCIPVVHINLAQDPQWNAWNFVGLAVWLAGFATEVVADRQLANFMRQSPQTGELMQYGLWRYARHPNYFGEITLWWGFALISLGTPHGWVGVGGAAAITYLILYVSGVPPKEKRLKKRPGWQAYKQKTRLLLPLPKPFPPNNFNLK